MVGQLHNRDEANLQILIEQLEAAQEAAVAQRTIDLDREIRQLEEDDEGTLKKAQIAQVNESRLNMRDDEVQELRRAIEQLSDERADLKLELEKNLSRLNHPDAGGKLVDRRVVRQLLVLYFRVGYARRHDILRLISRMLGFTDTDNEAVCLKRRALMDCIGSLVQPPEDGASISSISTVRGKWIEFLTRETEENPTHTPSST